MSQMYESMKVLSFADWNSKLQYETAIVRATTKCDSPFVAGYEGH